MVINHLLQGKFYANKRMHLSLCFPHLINSAFVLTGTPPDVMFISCEPSPPLVNEECTLHLCIRDFCPKDLLVSWTKDEETVSASIFNTPPSLNITGLYSMFSFLKITPNMEDQGSVFRCRVVHSSQRDPEERTFIFPKLHFPLQTTTGDLL